MADDPGEEADGPGALALGPLLPGDKILVTVESALPDILVVTYQHADKSFQGALLDATKRGLPCGVEPPEPVKGPDGDKLATIAARFSYFQEKRYPLIDKADQRRNLQSPARSKTTRPTVRLRPRQVLCSKCRSICNENSESVGRKRKLEEVSPSEPPTRRSDRRCSTQQQSQPQPQVEPASLLPKVERLRPDSSCGQEAAAAAAATTTTTTTNEAASGWTEAEAESSGRPMSAQPIELEGHQLECRATPRRLSSSSVESAKVPPAAEETATSTTTTTTSRRVPRKKRSVGLMEDLWDESVFEEPAAARPTPVIKISFGAQGEGTVLKIPPRMRSAFASEEEEDCGQPELDPLELPERREGALLMDTEDGSPDNLRYQAVCATLPKDCETPSSKAAKKALKKAKKKALRKMYGATSPARSPCNGSPRYQANLDKMLYHRRKHKVKHKKRHKEERKHKGQAPSICVEGDGAAVSQPQAGECGPLDDSAYTAIKEQCLRQKLSISLKRLNTNAYAAHCGQLGYPVSSASSGCKSPGATSDDEPGHGDDGDDEDDDEEGEPGAGGDFSAPPEHPLVVRLAASAGPGDRRMDVGDVVWGKVHGFPWWPGKVLSITDSCKEDGTPLGPQAHVAWYGSSTSSLMSCDQLSPFLETFKTRYNKKKKGPYKEAIRQAQSEARSQISPNSTTSNVLGVCGSPREVNVLS